MSSRALVPRTASARKTDLNAQDPSGLVLNKKGLRKFKDTAYKYRDVEFLYLRENEFTTFDPYIPLLNLKILDLSLNQLSGAVDFLPNIPNVRHLYLTGNSINTLKGFSELPSLETLTLSGNSISSFDGLEGLPNLRVLSLNYNSIASLRGFPFLPSLHSLNLVGNPVADIPSYRSMAIAASSTMLSAIDGVAITDAERDAVEHFRGKIVYCITEGFVVDGNQVEEAADEFLMTMQRETWKAKPLQLKSIFLTPSAPDSNVLMEGDPVSVHVCLQDTRPLEERTDNVFHCRHLFPVAFKVQGDAAEVFVVGSMNRWQGPIPLERCTVGDDVFFQTTLYLPAGDYEYRYIVDGVEKTSDLNKTVSKYKQGVCNVYRVSETIQTDFEEQDTILHLRWMRNNRYNGFSLIEEQNGLQYVPVGEDIGLCLRVEVLAYDKGEFSFLYFDISSPINPGAPVAKKFELVGTAAEGEHLVVEIEYSGGTEGQSQLQWFRIAADGTESAIELEDPWAGYSVALGDIGGKIRVQYTPIREDWVAGTTVSKTTAAIVAGVPCCKSLKITGTAKQSETLTAQVEYAGGFEGKSKFQWFRYDDSSKEYYAIPGETSSTYVPTLNDVRKKLALEYVPVSREGVEGEPNRITMDVAVSAAAPSVRRITMKGSCEEQHVLMLEYDYFGGFHGNHKIQWIRYEDEKSKRTVKIGRPNSATYTVTNKDVGFFIEAQFIPVRDDGVEGEMVTVTSEEKMRPGYPQLLAFSVAGEAKVGSVLEVVAEYFGGEQGDSAIEWYRSTSDLSKGGFDLIAKKTKKYVVQREDGGRMLKVCYTPIRTDGVQGEMKHRLIEVAVAEE